MRLPLFQSFAVNTVGRDFAVGDIHGCFVALERGLAALNFDPAVDRLFALGDLIDRGPHSDRLGEFLGEPWFHALRGNHDQMMIDAEVSGEWMRDWYHNGGLWAMGYTASELTLWRDAIDALPFAIEVATPQGVVGLVHADLITPTWRELREALEALQAKAPAQGAFYSSYAKHLVMGVLWSRDLARTLVRTVTDGVELAPIPDLKALVIGHTASRQPLHAGNVWLIDTGAGYRDPPLPAPPSALSFLNLHTFEIHQERTNTP
jgi:serine/threonine protein phosphatase 1